MERCRYCGDPGIQHSDCTPTREWVDELRRALVDVSEENLRMAARATRKEVLEAMNECIPLTMKRDQVVLGRILDSVLARRYEEKDST